MQAAITAARPGVSFTVTTAGSPDPNVADGLVIATTPDAETDPVPGSVGIEDNPDNDNPPGCTWQVNYRTGQTVEASRQGRNYVQLHDDGNGKPELWKCTEQPSTNPEDLDVTALNGGEWGCTAAAGGDDQPRLVAANDPETFYVPNTGDAPVGGDGDWFIAYGTLDKGSPSFDWSVNPSSIPETLG